MSQQEPQQPQDTAAHPEESSGEASSSGQWPPVQAPSAAQPVDEAPAAGPTAAYPAPSGYAPPPGYLAPGGYAPGYGPGPGYPLPPGYAPQQGPGGYSPAYPPAYPPPYVQAYGQPSGVSPTTSSNAIVAIILAITSWLVCPIVPAIVALVFAARADREVRASGGTIQGGGLSTAAKVVSWINIGIFVAVMLMAIVFFIVAAAIGALDAASGPA